MDVPAEDKNVNDVNVMNDEPQFNRLLFLYMHFRVRHHKFIMKRFEWL